MRVVVVVMDVQGKKSSSGVFVIWWWAKMDWTGWTQSTTGGSGQALTLISHVDEIEVRNREYSQKRLYGENE